MDDDNDISIGPGSEEDDDEIQAPARADVSRAAPPPPIVRHDGGTRSEAAPDAAPPAGERAAITPKAAPAAVTPGSAPTAPAARPELGAGPRLVSVEPVRSTSSPAPATPTTTAPIPTTDALAAQLASLQESIASLTSKVEGRAAPAPAATPAAPTAPEAVATESAEVDEKAVARDLATFAEKDRDCVIWSKEFKANDARIQELAKPGGEYHTLTRSIDYLNTQLDPKKYGIGDEVPDDVTRAEIEAKLEPKLAKQERLRLEHARLVDRNEALDTKFNERIAKAEAKIRGNFQARTQAAHADRERSAEVTASEREWHGAFKEEVLDRFNGLTDDRGQPNADALLLFNRLMERAYARVSSDPDLDFQTFIRENVQDEIVVLNAKRSKVTSGAAREKAADSRVPAPRGSAAVADSARPLSEITDPRERRRQVERDTATASKRLVLRTG